MTWRWRTGYIQKCPPAPRRRFFAEDKFKLAELCLTLLQKFAGRIAGEIVGFAQQLPA